MVSPIKPPKSVPPYHELSTTHQLRIGFWQRNGGNIIGDDDHGVPNLDCPTQIRRGLNKAYPALTSQFGWNPWQNDLVREVLVRDLGPTLHGLSGLVGRNNGQMAINARLFDAIPELVAFQRQATATHELVHLLQFQSPLFSHFYNPARFGAWDPNWWLHEATALAAEVSIVPEYPTAYARLWEWATNPQRSFEGDENGYRALPFVLYLMENVSTTFPATLYQTESDSFFAVDRLAAELNACSRDFATEFLSYCATVSPLQQPNRPSWLQSIDQIVGKRSYRERFNVYPVTSTNDVPVDHLGCRYFRFKPNKNSNGTLKTRLFKVTNIDLIEASIAVRAKSGELETIELEREPQQLVASVPDFTLDNIDSAVLTVANCGYGAGWSKFDETRFSVYAEVTRA